MKEILATCFIRVAIMIIQQVWIVHTYQERNVLVGEMVELECPFDTWLAIWVYWKKDNETIYSLKVEPQGVTSWSNDTARYLGTSQAKYLTITDLRETDSGVYDCKVVKDRPIDIILDSASEGSLVRLSVIDQVEVVPSTTSSIPYYTSEKIPAPPAKNEDGLGLLSLLILIPIAVIMVIMCCKRSRIREYISGKCMAARKRRGYRKPSPGSHEDPESAESNPLAKIDGKMHKSHDVGSNAQQTRIHGHDGEQQQKNDSVESQIHRSELTPEFDASSPSIEEEIGHGPPDDDDNVDAGPGDGEDTHRALIHGYDGEQQQKRDSVDSQISEFIPSDASSPFPNKENSKPTEYQLPLVGKLLLIDVHRADNKDAVVRRLLEVVHCHVQIAGQRQLPVCVEHRPSLEKFAQDRYPNQSIRGYTVKQVSYVLHELDQISHDRWRDRCEVLLTMPENQQQDKSVFYSESIHDSTRVVSENNSNDDNPERLGLLKDRMELWMANPDKRKHARYFISREILYADVPTKQTMTESFIDFQKSVPNVGYENSLNSDKYNDNITGDLVEFWMSKVQKLDPTCQKRILEHLFQPISDEDDYGGQQAMAAAGGVPQTKNKEAYVIVAIKEYLEKGTKSMNRPNKEPDVDSYYTAIVNNVGASMSSNDREKEKANDIKTVTEMNHPKTKRWKTT